MLPIPISFHFNIKQNCYSIFANLDLTAAHIIACCAAVTDATQRKLEFSKTHVIIEKRTFVSDEKVEFWLSILVEQLTLSSQLRSPRVAQLLLEQKNICASTFHSLHVMGFNVGSILLSCVVGQTLHY